MLFDCGFYKEILYFYIYTQYLILSSSDYINITMNLSDNVNSLYIYSLSAKSLMVENG